MWVTMMSVFDDGDGNDDIDAFDVVGDNWDNYSDVMIIIIRIVM